MKNSHVLGNNFYEYVKNNANRDPGSLYLTAAGKDYDFPIDFAITQIECRRKVAGKLSSFISDDRFLFPSVQAAEQSTHQSVALYHASLAGSGKRVVDMTAGLGIDAFTLHKNGNKVTAIELDPERASILRHNSAVLDMDGFEIIEGDSIDWIKKNENRRFDILFIDPARRTSDNRRTYFFKDCVPDITSDIDILKASADRIMVKASPILDIHQIIRELKDVTSLHIVCYKGECKEILIIMDKDAQSDDPEIITVDIHEYKSAGTDRQDIWSLRFSDLGNRCPIAESSDLIPGSYLYDPNAAVHKLNCSSVLCDRFRDMKKLAANTDLYISPLLHESFPGRIFKIMDVPDKATLKQLRNGRFETAVRNYPMSAEDLRKKLKVVQGSDDFIFGCSVGMKSRPTILICKKLERNLL